MALNRKRKPSTKQVEANRQNGRKSKGPRTPEGKSHVSLNALKHGLHAQPLVQSLLAMGEKPSAYYRLLAQLVASLHPANPHQRMQVEDLARLRLEKLRLERARAAQVAGKMRRLELERARRQLEFDCEAPDLPQAELLSKGLDRVADSPPKFEKMLSCLDVLISVAKQGDFTLDPEPELNLLYGQEPSLEGAYLRNVFRRFVAAQSGDDNTVAQDTASEQDPIPNPKWKTPNGEGPPGQQERFLLLKTLFGAKQRALRRYQLYNREFIETSPDQRDACYAPSEDADLGLMRLQDQNDRQLRLALKLYWQTQKEDAARVAQPGETSEEAERWMADLHSKLSVISSENSEPRTQNPDVASPNSPLLRADAPNLFDGERSQQVVEKTGEVSGIGQNNPNFGHSLTPCPAAGEGGARPESQVPNSAPPIEAARPKVKELLEQMQSDPEARALVETFLLNQMVQEEGQQEEAEVEALQREKEKRETLEQGLEQMVAAEQELESSNRRLRARVGGSEITHQQVLDQIKPAEAVVAERYEPTHEEIIAQISAAIGVGQPMRMRYRVKSQVEGMPDYHLTNEELADYQQGRGPAWEEEQRRRREYESKC